MFLGIALALTVFGQHPMDFKARQLELDLSLVKELPREQIEAAKQIILLGGTVYTCREPKRHLAELIHFTGDKFTDAEIALLTPFKGTPISSIGCGKTRLTDDGIAQMLAAFPNAKSLGVLEQHATDAALAPLDKFHDLETFNLRGQQFTSASLRHLAHQPALWSLDVSETSIDDQGLQCLENLRALKWVFLSQTKIASAGVASLGKIVSLETLTLNDTKVGDDGLAHLATLQKLKTLRLDGTRVTNAGMAHIAKLTALSDVNLERTKVDAQGIALLQNMPKLEEVRWLDEDKATPEQKRFNARFHLYLPANANRWKDAREKFERGELKFD